MSLILGARSPRRGPSFWFDPVQPIHSVLPEHVAPPCAMRLLPLSVAFPSDKVDRLVRLLHGRDSESDQAPQLAPPDNAPHEVQVSAVPLLSCSNLTVPARRNTDTEPHRYLQRQTIDNQDPEEQKPKKSLARMSKEEKSVRSKQTLTEEQIRGFPQLLTSHLQSKSLHATQREDQSSYSIRHIVFQKPGQSRS